MARLNADEIERLYKEGLGLKGTDDRLACYKFAIAADAGHAQSAFECGVYATQGYYKITRKYQPSFYMRMGDESVAENAKLENKFYKEALPWFKQAEKGGSADALCMLGKYSYYGWAGVRQDFNLAVQQFNKALEQGCITAYSCLGLCYLSGRGVEKDIKKAVQMFFIGTRKRCPEATLNLAKCYQNGAGVEKNSSKAYVFALISANMNHPPAIFTVGKYYIMGIGVPKSLSEGLEWIEKARNEYSYYSEMSFEDYCKLSDTLQFNSAHYLDKAKQAEAQGDDRAAIENYTASLESGFYESKYRLASLLHNTKTEYQNDKKAISLLMDVASAYQTKFYSDSVNLMEEIADSYANELTNIVGMPDSCSLDKILNSINLVCDKLLNVSIVEGEPYDISACDNPTLNTLFKNAREIEKIGHNFTEALDIYLDCAKRGHPDAMYRFIELSRKVGNEDNVHEVKQLAKNISHPMIDYHIPSMIKLARQGNEEAVFFLGNALSGGNFSKGLPKSPVFAKLFYTCASRLYFMRAQSGDPEAIYMLATYLSQYIFESSWKERHEYKTYGLTFYDMANDYPGDDPTPESLEHANRAIACGVKKAQLIIDLHNNIMKKKSELVTAQREFQRKENERFLSDLDQKERNWNYFMEGKYRTEWEAQVAGDRDPWQALVHQQWRDKKIEERENLINLLEESNSPFLFKNQHPSFLDDDF